LQTFLFSYFLIFFLLTYVIRWIVSVQLRFRKQPIRVPVSLLSNDAK